MKKAIALSLLLSLSPMHGMVYADGLLDEKPEIIEVVAPDGSKQKGFMRDGKFVLLSKSAGEAPATPKKEEAKPDITTGVTTLAPESEIGSRITVQKELVPLRSRLKKQYTGHKLTITNNWENPVEIVSAQVVGGTNGQQGYLMVEKGSGAAIGGLLGGGLLVGIFTLGIGFLVGLVASPIVWGVNKAKNSKARKEGMQFNNQIPFGAISPGESVTFATLVPAGSDAQIKATMRDTVTREMFAISR